MICMPRSATDDAMLFLGVVRRTMGHSTGLFNSAEPRKEKRKEKDHPLLE
jgi:hypothetical protein